MIIGIRKNPNGNLYMDKNIFSSGKYSESFIFEHYKYKKVEIGNIYSDCISSDFNDDLTFNIEKYNTRKQKENSMNYENLVVSKIRKKYNINQELAILRQRDVKPQEFAEYNEFVEMCKTEARREMQ